MGRGTRNEEHKEVSLLCKQIFERCIFVLMFVYIMMVMFMWSQWVRGGRKGLSRGGISRGYEVERILGQLSVRTGAGDDIPGSLD